MKWIIFILFPIVTFICNNPKQMVSRYYEFKKVVLGYGCLSRSVVFKEINPALRKAFVNRNSGREKIQVLTGIDAEIILKLKRKENSKVLCPEYNAPDNSCKLTLFIAGMKSSALYIELSRYAENRTEHVEHVNCRVATLCLPVFLAEVGENHDFLPKSCKRT